MHYTLCQKGVWRGGGIQKTAVMSFRTCDNGGGAVVSVGGMRKRRRRRLLEFAMCLQLDKGEMLSPIESKK